MSSEHEFEVESVPDWEEIVDGIVVLMGEREECTFVDDDLEIWEVQRSEEGDIMALCLGKNAMLRIKRSEF
jgi:hypothetical protein